MFFDCQSLAKFRDKQCFDDDYDSDRKRIYSSIIGLEIKNNSNICLFLLEMLNLCCLV